MRVALKGVAATLILAAPMLRVRADLVIGTVVDVNMMETEKQDFEEGWAEWRETNMELIDTTNNSDSRVIFYSLKKRYVMTSILLKGAKAERSSQRGSDRPCTSSASVTLHSRARLLYRSKQ